MSVKWLIELKRKSEYSFLSTNADVSVLVIIIGHAVFIYGMAYLLTEIFI